MNGITGVRCGFCGVYHKGHHVQCPGCGAALGDALESSHANEKLLALATDLNRLMRKNASQTRTKSRLRRMVLGVSVTSSLLIVWIWYHSFNASVTYVEDGAGRSWPANNRSVTAAELQAREAYTRVLEQQLFEEHGPAASLPEQ